MPAKKNLRIPAVPDSIYSRHNTQTHFQVRRFLEREAEWRIVVPWVARTCELTHDIHPICVDSRQGILQTNIICFAKFTENLFFIYRTTCKIHIMISLRGDFWAWPVHILVFLTPTGYMLTSFGFPWRNWGIFYKFLLNYRSFSCSLELQPVISQAQPVHCDQLPVLPDQWLWLSLLLLSSLIAFCRA